MFYKQNMDYLNKQYANILDDSVLKSSNINVNSIENSDVSLTPVFQSLQQHVDKYNIQKIIVSLSGGVDSMVLLTLLAYIINPVNIIACHINYNNRCESDEEQSYLEDYCETKGITFLVHKMNIVREGSIKRADYEKQTRLIRYQFYQQLCLLYAADGVMLGHHKDDVIENIFNNIMRGGRNISDLSVLRDNNCILDVSIHRPFIEYEKEIIYEIAHVHRIPYFKDTTPDWSCRGKMRRNIFPSLVDCYTGQYKKNLFNLSQEGEELGNIIQKYLVQDIMNNIIINDKDFTIPNKECLKEFYILKHILQSISHHINIPCMKLKNIQQLANIIGVGIAGKVPYTLLNNYSIVISEDTVIFERKGNALL